MKVSMTDRKGAYRKLNHNNSMSKKIRIPRLEEQDQSDLKTVGEFFQRSLRLIKKNVLGSWR